MNEYLSFFPELINILLLIYIPINNLANKYLEQRISPSIESPINWQLNPAKFYHFILKIFGDWSIALVFIFAIIIGYKFKWYYSFFFLLQTVVIPSVIIGLIKGVFLIFFKKGGYYFWNIQTFIGKTRVITVFVVDILLYYSLFKFIFQS